MNLSSAARIAQSGLSSVTGEMSIVSRNITGAGTDSYSRKIGHVVSTSSGPQLAATSRASNLAVFTNLLVSTAGAAAKDMLAAGLDRLAESLGDPATGTGSPTDALGTFMNALRAYAATPSDTTAAGTAVAEAETVTQMLNAAATLVQQERKQADSDIARSVQTINVTLEQIGFVNAQIVKGTVAGTDVTGLLDQRDARLSDLSREIGIATSVGADGDLSVYTDSGVTLFQGGRARSVTFEARSTYTPATRGNPVVVDGVPVTGSTAVMSIGSGKLAGAAALRDDVAVTYQAQLDGIAAALISAFAESDQIGSGPDRPGLFTIPGVDAVPTSSLGLAAIVSVNSSVDPARGGNPELLRDGGVSSPGDLAYTYNTEGHASFAGRIDELLGKMSETHTFAAGGRIDTEASIAGYAIASSSWLSSVRSTVASEKTYQEVLLNTASAAFSEVSGVDLDSEMSKMLALEQSYSATARLIAAIDDMFAVLLNRL